MSVICPVCNGLQQVIAHCPSCDQLVADMGKLVDFSDPYSPYRDMDDLASSPDYSIYGSSMNGCIHWTYCPSCRRSAAYEVSIFEE
jgi:hypothetical protein